MKNVALTWQLLEHRHELRRVRPRAVVEADRDLAHRAAPAVLAPRAPAADDPEQRRGRRAAVATGARASAGAVRCRGDARAPGAPPASASSLSRRINSHTQTLVAATGGRPGRARLFYDAADATARGGSRPGDQIDAARAVRRARHGRRRGAGGAPPSIIRHRGSSSTTAGNRCAHALGCSCRRSRRPAPRRATSPRSGSPTSVRPSSSGTGAPARRCTTRSSGRTPAPRR